MRCTKGQLEEFFEKSKIWTDICEELDKWVADNHIRLEDPDGTMRLEDFKHHAGICTALKRVKDIWAYMEQDFLTEEENRNG